MPASYDLLIRRARLRSGDIVDIGIQGETIAALQADLAGEASRVIEAAGRLTSPPLIEPHCHLDAILTEGDAGHNESGTLLEGIARWAVRKQSLTPEDVRRRATEGIKWYASQGALYIRSHVDICDPKLTALKALLEVKEACRDLVDLQLVAFPQEGILSYAQGEALMEEALRLGCDVVGAIPHYEITREMGVESLHIAFRLAEKYDRPIDAHCDETDDEQSRFVEVLTANTIRHDMQGRVTASHTTAMHSYNNAYTFKLFGWLKRAQMHIIANPPDNIILQGRFDTYPKRRGMTRIKELLEAGINVAVGHDSVMDPWYPFGTGNMLHAAFLAMHIAQMSGYSEVPRVWDLVTENAARVLGVEERYGLAPGKQADLVIFDAPSERDALRMMAPALYCIKRGRVISETTSPRVQVFHEGKSEEIRFVKQ
ncbi:MAG: cytosine deaminase [Nitrospinota bacterium]|nr:MAG: cytosine deaminase [Nitrospinota bacterium]